MRVLKINLLGGFSIFADGEAITALESPRFQSLLTYLTLHRTQPVSRRQLAFQYWPDSSEAQAHANLRKLIYDLRRAFPRLSEFLEIKPSNIKWRPGIDFQVDSEAFERAIAQANRPDALEQAIALYPGELLPGCYDDWALVERQRLEALYMTSLERLVQWLEEQREYPRAIRYAEQLQQAAPMEEEHYRTLMRLFALVGDRAGVVHTYSTCASTLRRELDIEPSELTRLLYQRLIRAGGDKDLEMPLPAGLNPYQDQWVQLQSAWRAVLSGNLQWVLLDGDDLNGKSVVLHNLAQWALRLNIPHTAVTCYPTDLDLAYAPLQTILRSRPLPALDKIWLPEIARLMPEILIGHPELAPPPPLRESWQINRFYEAIARVILYKEPMMLVIRNLHWSDPQTLKWLVYLGRYNPNARLMIIATLARQSLSQNNLLKDLIQTLEADEGLIRVDFGQDFLETTQSILEPR